MITIDLPVPAYIKIYLLSLYGANYKVSLNDDLGILILNILQKKGGNYNYYKRETDNRNEVFSIRISFSMFEKFGCIISENQLYHIHKAIDSGFRMNLYRNAIINKNYSNIQYKDSILSFLKAFNINEEQLSYETIRKDFNRKKVEIEEKLNLIGHI